MVKRRFFYVSIKFFFSTMIKHKSVMFQLSYATSCVKSDSCKQSNGSKGSAHQKRQRLCCVNIVFLEYIFFLFFRFGYSVVLNEPIDCSYVFPSVSGSPRMPSVCAVFLGDKEAFLGNDNKANTWPIVANVGLGH